MTEARHAIRGLGEEMGLHMPRFVSSWLTSLGGVAPVMAMAFAPIAVLGFIHVLAEIPEKLHEGLDALHGWTEASKKAFEESTRDALKWQVELLHYEEQLRAIELIGLNGMPKLTAEMRLNAKATDEAQIVLNGFLERQKELKELLEWKPTPNPKMAGLEQYGLPEAAPEDVAQGPRHDEVKKAEAELKELAPRIEDLQKKIRELGLESKRIGAETKVEGRDEAQRAREAGEQITADLERRLLAQAEQTLEIRHKEWDADIDGTRKRYEREGELTKDQVEMLLRLRVDGHARIERDQAEADQRQQEAERKAGEDAEASLRERIARQDDTTRAGREKAYNAEMDALLVHYRNEGKIKEGQLGILNDLVARLRAAGLAKLQTGWDKEDADLTARLQRELDGEATRSAEAKHKLWDEDIDRKIAGLDKGNAEYARQLALEVQIREAGQKKIDAEAQAAFGSRWRGWGRSGSGSRARTRPRRKRSRPGIRRTWRSTARPRSGSCWRRRRRSSRSGRSRRGSRRCGRRSTRGSGGS